MRYKELIITEPSFVSRLALCSFIAVIALFLISVAVSSAHAVILKVKITNATKGENMSSYPFDVVIDDSISSPKRGSTKALTFQTGPEGMYKGDLDIQENKKLTVEVNYRGIKYRSQTVEVKNSVDHLSLPVPVYDISDRSENIAITERFVTVVPHDDKAIIQVYEQLEVDNSGDKTYVGKFNDELDLTQVLHIPLPAGYSLNGLQGISYQMTYTLGNALVTREDIKPGKHRLSIYYRLVSDTGFFDLSMFSQKDAPEIRNMSLYFPQKTDWKIKLSGLKSAGDHTMGDKTFDAWKGRGDSVTKVRVYAPSYRNPTLFWSALLIPIFGIAFGTLYVCNGPIRQWNMKRERKRLETILADINDNAEEAGKGEFYRPFTNIITSRLKEIDQRLDT